MPKIRTPWCLIGCLVKDTSREEEISIFEKSKTSDSNIHNKSLPVDILIGSDFMWSIFENEIISGIPIAIKTNFEYVLSGTVAKVQNLSNSTLTFYSWKCITEIPNNECKEETFEKFSEMECLVTTSLKIFVLTKPSQGIVHS